MEFFKIILSSIISVVILFVIAKIMGHKQVAQLDFFDYISGITIGSIAAELATSLEDIWKPVVAILVYGGISIALSTLSAKCPKTRKYINGAPSILFDNNKLYPKNLKKAKLDLSEFMLLCREQGYFKLSDIETAVFEHNGKLTVLPKSESRPLTPSDMGMSPSTEHLLTELIMDGRIMGENLKRAGLDETWLEKELKKQGYKNSKEIFLSLCDRDKNVTFYPY